MKRAGFLVLGLLLILALVYFFYINTKNKDGLSIDSFEECAKYFMVAESYPRQCYDSKGNYFVEDIGNVLEKQDLIRLDNIVPNQEIESPQILTGEARGFWFFEASFPVRLYDEDNNLIATAIATAQSDYMTTDFVRFESEIFFESTVGKGYLVLEKDNPSGLPENYDELRVPVLLK